MRTHVFVVALLAAFATGQSTWLDVSPLTGPSARSYAVMAYDSQRGVVVLFGGRNDQAILGDTWEWDGFLWTRKTPTVAPPARWGIGPL